MSRTRSTVWLALLLMACAPSDFDRLTSGAKRAPPDGESVDAFVDSAAAATSSDASAADAMPAVDAADGVDAMRMVPAHDAAMDSGSLSERDANTDGAPDGGAGGDAASADAGTGSPCQSFEIPCHGSCVDPSVDRANCGLCDWPCAAEEACLDGVCADASGCSDGAREAFADRTMYPTIAGCAASWSLASMSAPPTGQACGNGLARPCAVPADACAADWHVCGLRGVQELSDRVTQAECVSPPGRFAAALSDHHCEECGNGQGYGAVCCGTDCWIQGGVCVWPGATPWFGLDANNYIMSCGAIHNPLGDTQGVLCCHDSADAGVAARLERP